MKNYRVVEIAPEGGRRYSKNSPITLYKGPDKKAMKQAIEDYHEQKKRRPWGELFYYHGTTRIYAYEL